MCLGTRVEVLVFGVKSEGPMSAFETPVLSSEVLFRNSYACRGSSLIRNSPPSQDYHRALGIFLL